MRKKGYNFMVDVWKSYFFREKTEQIRGDIVLQCVKTLQTELASMQGKSSDSLAILLKCYQTV